MHFRPITLVGVGNDAAVGVVADVVNLVVGLLVTMFDIASRNSVPITRSL